LFDVDVAVQLIQVVCSCYRLLNKAEAVGLENIPTNEPVVFVGNHQLFGIDSPQMIINILEEQLGIWPRPLADHFHFSVPLWKHFLEYGGVVNGSRENAAAIMVHIRHLILTFGDATLLMHSLTVAD
jgi:1-acyl-sn-glycerol-3-phosphate acyltransferase